MSKQPFWTGCCDWAHEDWRQVFYPPDLPPSEWLAFYARFFNAVEVDSTFYHVPAQAEVRRWHEATPEEFRFCCKMPRWVTHELRLRDAEEFLTQFFHSLSPLGSKLGPFLIELPSFFRPSHDAGSLRAFLKGLPTEFQYAIRFASSEWHRSGTSELLTEHGVATVWADTRSVSHQAESAFDFYPDTAPFLVLRLMGPVKSKGNGADTIRYGRILWERRQALEAWAARLQRYRTRKELFVFASDQYEGFAAATCRHLAEAMSLPQELPQPLTEADDPESNADQLDLF